MKYRLDYKEEQEQELEVLKSIYPDEFEEIPEMSLEVLEGSLEENEHDKFYTDLINMARDSIGMAMVFTLTSFLKDSLTTFVVERQEQRKKAEEDRIRKEIEAEHAKFQGTKVTVASFLEWKENFEREIAEKERNTKSLALLKKEEMRKNKLTGRQLFEHDQALAKSDATFMDEDDVAVDISLFEREVDVESEEDENDVLDLVRNSTDE
ncbi:17661_t:CDS:2 [Racocetra fulgida]|uniref:17661_t:CDS:1 n=1 Tax=Racocetra fulgida TaxID=60492 RepID=A0A9N9FFU2_9GLOM|nr:17661_t:CDS:2 [Racocetra fulgida]